MSWKHTDSLGCKQPKLFAPMLLNLTAQRLTSTLLMLNTSRMTMDIGQANYDHCPNVWMKQRRTSVVVLQNAI